MTERTFTRGLSVLGPNAELGLGEDQSAYYPEGYRGELAPGVLAIALEAGALAPLPGDPTPADLAAAREKAAAAEAKKAAKKGKVENLADFDGDGTPGGDAAAAKAEA